MKSFCKLIKKPTIQKQNGQSVNKTVYRKETLKVLKGIQIFIYLFIFYLAQIRKIQIETYTEIQL